MNVISKTTRKGRFWKVALLGLSLLISVSDSWYIQIPLPRRPPKTTLKSLKLEGLANIETNTITTSGISSGAYMAVMFHYMFSTHIKGVGAFGAGPFGVLHNTTGREKGLRMFRKELLRNALPIIGRSADFLEKQAIELSNLGLIDPINNLNESKVFIFEGGLDHRNPPWMHDLSVETYKYFGSDIDILFIPNATHCIPTDNYGLPCGWFNPWHDGVNNCDNFSISHMFSHFFGFNYIPPRSSTAPTTGKFYEFDQNPHAPSGNAIADFIHRNGGIYIPEACQVTNNTCKLHIAFNGCIQTIYSTLISDLFATKTGYFQVADVNQIIILFPRPAPELYAYQYTDRTNGGCWDWFGTTTLQPELKGAPQVIAVTNMMNTLIGSTLF